jgi:uncharacterized DUF497 family protein
VYICAYNADERVPTEQGRLTMDYEWNPDKAVTNLHKHDISFADAVAVFSDPFALTAADDFATEERFVTLGMDAFGRLLVVVYTWRGEQRIRIISARKATRHERMQYER